jgi:hypothetical protein
LSFFCFFVRSLYSEGCVSSVTVSLTKIMVKTTGDEMSQNKQATQTTTTPNTTTTPHQASNRAPSKTNSTHHPTSTTQQDDPPPHPPEPPKISSPVQEVAHLVPLQQLQGMALMPIPCFKAVLTVTLPSFW